MTKKHESRYNGVLIVDKPQDFTSFDVVAKLRGILHERRIGHGGTLDPMATGVLPVFVGGATKAADMAAAQSKEYIAAFALGWASDTQDSTGTETARSEVRVTAQQLREAVDNMHGEQEQVPPMYSAVKVNGQRLYDLARKGVEVERKARPITVHEAELLAFDEQEQQGRIRFLCSKGTYVRTLVHDLGVTLGTYAVMTGLQRTKSGCYTLAQSYSLEQIEQAAQQDAIESLLLQTDSLFQMYPAVSIDEYGYQRAMHGAFITPEHVTDMPQQQGAVCRVYYQGEFWMLGRVDALDRGGLALFYEKRFR